MPNDIKDLEPDFYTSKEMSQLLGVNYVVFVATLNGKKIIGNYPPFIKVGNRIKFHKSDYRKWLETEKKNLTSPNE